ncbi:hypothetical protein M501DRAFT_954919, partial [Patellaria atrata CBS 101060]
MPSRRSHKNSHHGCSQCKASRVKCDEHTPQCLRCQRRNQPCSYQNLWTSYKPSNSDELISEEPSNELVFLNTASSTVKLDSKFGNDAMLMWDKAIRQHITGHGFLYHSVSALSALHLAIVYEQDRRQHLAKALEHQNAGIALFRPGLNNFSKDNAEALMTFAGITVIYTFALPLAAATPHTPIFVDPLKELRHVISLFRGLVAIFRLSIALNLAGNLSSGIRRVTQIAPSFEVDDPAAEASLDLLAPSIEHLQDPAARAMYLHTVEALRKILKRAAGMPNTASVILPWPGMVHPGYVAALEAEEPIAVVILAHWAACLHGLKGVWWTQKWGKATVRACGTLLGRNWRRFLEW